MWLLHRLRLPLLILLLQPLRLPLPPPLLQPLQRLQRRPLHA